MFWLDTINRKISLQPFSTIWLANWLEERREDDEEWIEVRGWWREVKRWFKLSQFDQQMTFGHIRPICKLPLFSEHLKYVITLSKLKILNDIFLESQNNIRYSRCLLPLLFKNCRSFCWNQSGNPTPTPIAPWRYRFVKVFSVTLRGGNQRSMRECELQQTINPTIFGLFSCLIHRCSRSSRRTQQAEIRWSKVGAGLKQELYLNEERLNSSSKDCEVFNLSSQLGDWLRASWFFGWFII